MRALLAIGIAATLTGCAGHATNSAFPDDASLSSRDSDVPDRPFACGAQPGLTCEPMQYCVIGCTEGTLFCTALLDSGVCPLGARLTAECGSDAFPCASDDRAYPTVCLDNLDAATCPYDSVPSVPPRTYECTCSL